LQPGLRPGPYAPQTPGILSPRNVPIPPTPGILSPRNVPIPPTPGILSPRNVPIPPTPRGIYAPQRTPGIDGSLAAQMGAMSVGGEPGTPRHKKKDRHAYHDLDVPAGSSQAYNGMPQHAVNASQFLDTPAASARRPDSIFTGQVYSPSMNQFPATAGGTFISGGHPPGATMTVTGGAAGSSTPGRVDPEQIPSVPRSRDGPAEFYRDHVYRTMEQHLPPPGAVPFVALDQGNSSPRFARLTLNNIPHTSEALAATALPLGLVLQPLAAMQPGEPAIPLLDFGEPGPPRCRRCRTYVNPFMTFSNGGNKFVCNMCTFPNDVPPEYFAPTDPGGVRVDREQRPELRLGTVEFMVPKEYWAKVPVGLRWLFVIDVSQESINRGFLEAFCHGILAALYGEDAGEPAEGEPAEEPPRSIPPGSKVGFVTFDRDIHFYNCHVTPSFRRPAGAGRS
jgi:protein transport protein SEC24